MPETFDLILRGGVVATPGGLVQADVGVSDGRIAAFGDFGSPDAAAGRRRRGPARPAGRHRHPGPLPRARPGAQGGPRDRHRAPRRWAASPPSSRCRTPSRRPIGAADARRQAAARAAAACGATTPSSSARPPENVGELAELERLPGCAGVKMFMGSSTGDAAGRRRRRRRARCCAQGSRRVAVHAEDESAPARALHASSEGGARPACIPNGATPRRRFAATRRLLGAGAARPGGASTSCTSPRRRRWTCSRSTRTSPPSR